MVGFGCSPVSSACEAWLAPDLEVSSEFAERRFKSAGLLSAAGVSHSTKTGVEEIVVLCGSSLVERASYLWRGIDDIAVRPKLCQSEKENEHSCEKADPSSYYCECLS